MGPGVTGVIGLLFGSLIAWLALRSRTATLHARLSLMEKELAVEKADLARLQQAYTCLLYTSGLYTLRIMLYTTS